MFTKEDYRDYFSQISLVERAMVYRLHRLIAKIDDKEIHRTASRIIKGEKRHYTYVLSALESHFFDTADERRKYRRETSFGDVSIMQPGGAVKSEARCVDISSGGVGLESDVPLKAGDRFRVRINFYSKKEPLDRTGKIAWTEEIKIDLPSGDMLHFYMAGMQFGG